jgi:hypothetical protein
LAWGPDLHVYGRKAMIPAIYKRMAQRLRPHIVYLLFAVFIGALLLSTTIVFGMTHILMIRWAAIPMGVGLLILFISWYLILVRAWFFDKPPGAIRSKLMAMFPVAYVTVKTIFEWVASVFLFVWLLIALYGSLSVMFQGVFGLWQVSR